MPNDPRLKTAYAYLYIRDFDAARRAFEQAILEEPDNPEYHFHASVTALRSGDTQDAEAAARQAVSLDPENPLYLAHLGAVQAQALVQDANEAIHEGRIADSKAILERALTVDPLCEPAYHLLNRLNEQFEG